MVAASIRYKNPGAMWGSATARKWGAAANAVTLNDGKGQGNNIAVFPTYVDGICAQIDLWRSSHYYKNKPFKVGIETWSGRNSVKSYIKLVTARVPGMTGDTVMDDAFWRNKDRAIAFLKAQAFHEAGQEYPCSDDDWETAYDLVMGVTRPQPVASPPDIEEPEDEPAEAKPGFFKRMWKRVAGATGFGGLALYDWQIAVVVAVFALIVLGLLLWLMGPSTVRGWIKKQVA